MGGNNDLAWEKTRLPIFIHLFFKFKVKSSFQFILFYSARMRMWCHITEGSNLKKITQCINRWMYIYIYYIYIQIFFSTVNFFIANFKSGHIAPPPSIMIRVKIVVWFNSLTFREIKLDLKFFSFTLRKKPNLLILCDYRSFLEKSENTTWKNLYSEIII